MLNVLILRSGFTVEIMITGVRDNWELLNNRYDWNQYIQNITYSIYYRATFILFQVFLNLMVLIIANSFKCRLVNRVVDQKWIHLK